MRAHILRCVCSPLLPQRQSIYHQIEFVQNCALSNKVRTKSCSAEWSSPKIVRRRMKFRQIEWLWLMLSRAHCIRGSGSTRKVMSAGRNDNRRTEVTLIQLHWSFSLSDLFRPASMLQFSDFWKSVITENDVWYSVACSNGTWFLTALALLLCKWHFWYFLIIYGVICPVSHHQWRQCLQNARKGCALLIFRRPNRCSLRTTLGQGYGTWNLTQILNFRLFFIDHQLRIICDRRLQDSTSFTSFLVVFIVVLIDFIPEIMGFSLTIHVHTMAIYIMNLNLTYFSYTCREKHNSFDHNFKGLQSFLVYVSNNKLAEKIMP